MFPWIKLPFSAKLFPFAKAPKEKNNNHLLKGYVTNKYPLHKVYMGLIMFRCPHPNRPKDHHFRYDFRKYSDTPKLVIFTAVIFSIRFPDQIRKSFRFQVFPAKTSTPSDDSPNSYARNPRHSARGHVGQNVPRDDWWSCSSWWKFLSFRTGLLGHKSSAADFFGIFYNHFS